MRNALLLAALCIFMCGCGNTIFNGKIDKDQITLLQGSDGYYLKIMKPDGRSIEYYFHAMNSHSLAVLRDAQFQYATVEIPGEQKEVIDGRSLSQLLGEVASDANLLRNKVINELGKGSAGKYKRAKQDVPMIETEQKKQ
jgi:hypothetical protein